MLCIQHATLLTPGQCVDDSAVVVDGGQIVAVGRSQDNLCPPESQVIDATGLRLVPGFIDLQLNGAFGLDFTADPATIWEAAAPPACHAMG
jgi:N-acetylglucosamine-6-phosphate deacetylase